LVYFKRAVPARAQLAILCALLLGAVLAGCGRYHPGSAGEPGFTTLHVEVVKSETIVPQAHALVTTRIREAFIRDGRVQLVDSADQADAVLSLVLEKYARDITVTQPNDTGLARRYDVTLTARATLTDRRTGRNIFAARSLQARRGAFADSGNVQAEYQLLPLLAEKLAEESVRATLDRW
jgi:outer membrane lipopolysaccharide assembly protein LptE/RlpB